MRRMNSPSVPQGRAGWDPSYGRANSFARLLAFAHAHGKKNAANEFAVPQGRRGALLYGRANSFARFAHSHAPTAKKVRRMNSPFRKEGRVGSLLRKGEFIRPPCAFAHAPYKKSAANEFAVPQGRAGCSPLRKGEFIRPLCAFARAHGKKSAANKFAVPQGRRGNWARFTHREARARADVPRG